VRWGGVAVELDEIKKIAQEAKKQVLETAYAFRKAVRPKREEGE